jgi:NADPH:quinone reductase-like Zn-dependent oxidoreductase
VLHVREAETPVPGDDELLIKVHAAEATKADCELRSFRLPVRWTWLPLRIGWGLLRPRKRILGAYFAGEVEAVGRGVSRFKPGDEVFGATRLRFGAYGEYVCLPARYTIVPKPRNLSFEEAAAVPLGGLNAFHFLSKADIREGEKVLVNGAGGSIGTFGVQIARAMGAEVTAVDGAHKEAMPRRIGAHHFVDYAREDFSEGGRSYDVILSTVARASYSRCVGALRPNGPYLLANPRVSDMLRSVFTSKSSDKKAVVAFAGEREEELLALKGMIEAGTIRPVVDGVYPIEQAAEAHRRVETERRSGLVVISLRKGSAAG